MRIALVGPYPPPYGGISIHIQRLEDLLRADHHTTVVFKDCSVRRWLLRSWGDWFDFDVIHFHDVSWKSRALIGLLGFLGMPVVLTIHGDSLRDQLSKGNRLKSGILGFAMRHLAHVICVKTEIRDLLLSLEVSPSRISVINAYLPPIIYEPVTFPEEINSFLDSHSPLIVANGFGVVPLSEGTDLYGIELTLVSCAKLMEEFPNLGCLFFLAQIDDQERYKELQKKKQGLGLSNHFRFVLGKEFVSVLTQANIFLRPTFRDGHSLSVDEALYFNVPVVASDVVDRGESVHLFKEGDVDDLFNKINEVLLGKATVDSPPPTSSYERLLSVYHSVTCTT